MFCFCLFVLFFLGGVVFSFYFFHGKFNNYGSGIKTNISLSPFVFSFCAYTFLKQSVTLFPFSTMLLFVKLKKKRLNPATIFSLALGLGGDRHQCIFLLLLFFLTMIELLRCLAWISEPILWWS